MDDLPAPEGAVMVTNFFVVFAIVEVLVAMYITNAEKGLLYDFIFSIPIFHAMEYFFLWGEMGYLHNLKIVIP